MLIDEDFLYLLAFSTSLQNLTLTRLKDLVSQFPSHSRLCSLVFFFIFRKFIFQEKRSQEVNKDFNLQKFEKASFMDCLKTVSELLILHILLPYK